MTIPRHNASPEAIAAVVALGKASADHRRHVAGLGARERGMVERVARVSTAPAALIELVGEATTAMAARERALSLAWPASSGGRPSGNAETVARVEEALGALDDPRISRARSVTALDPDNAASLIAELRHLLDLRARLQSADCDRGEFGTGDVRVAADVTEILVSLEADDEEKAKAALDRMERTQARLDAVGNVALDLLSNAGLPLATVSQTRNIARALAAMPFPATRALSSTPDLRIVGEALAAAIERREALARTIAKIDAHLDARWKSERPSKLSQAATILANPEDRRGTNARKYAVSLGLRGEPAQTSRQLKVMAESLEALALPALSPEIASFLAPLEAKDEADLKSMRDYVNHALAWRDVLDGSEMASHAIGRLLASGRYPPQEIAAFIAETLGEIVAREGKVPLADVMTGNRRDLEALKEALAKASALGRDMMARGKSARRTLKEHRLSEARIRADAHYDAEVGVDGLCDGIEWLDMAERVLPASVDPRDDAAIASLRVALEEARREAIVAARKLLAIGKIVGADATGWDLPQISLISRIHGAALASSALEKARERVSRVDGYHLVAALEEDSVPGERWADYLEVGPPAPSEDDPAPPRPDIPSPEGPKVDRRPAFDFSDERSWSRRVIRPTRD